MRRKRAFIWLLMMLVCFVIMGCGTQGDISLSEISDNNEARQEEYLKEKQEEVSAALADASGSLVSYTQNPDGTWECAGNTYKYKLEITGRMNNATCDTTFVYLSNIEDITFDQAWKAAGLSSNSNDYFDIENAVLVDWINEE